MNIKKITTLIVMLVFGGLVLAACQGEPQVERVVETVVVTEVVEREGETIVETQIVEVERTVEVQVTPEPEMMDVPTVNYRWESEPPTADPQLATDTTSSKLIGSIFTGLTDIDDETKAAVPALATDWESNEDNTVWTFNLRDDIPWVKYNQVSGEIEPVLDDEGNPRMVNAHDVVYGVKRALDPNTASDYAYILYPIAGGEELNTTDPEAENFQELYDTVGVEALDDFTVQFTLNFSASFWPQVTTMSTTYPAPQWVIDEYGDRWVEPGFIVTNGAYVMEEWVHGDHLYLQKNPNWPLWGTDYGSGNIERLVGFVVEETSTGYAMYENNELDTAPVPLEQIQAIRDDPELSEQFVNVPINCTYYYGFVTTKPPVDDPRVRRALSMGIDRLTLVETVTQGGQIPANTFTNPLNFGNVAEDTDIAPWALSEEQGGMGYDQAVAMGQDLLAEAGFANGAGLDLLLMHNVSESHARIAQAIQAMWQGAYPEMTVTVETQEWAVYLDTIRASTDVNDVPHVFRLGWCADYPHANNWLHEVFNSEAGANRIRISVDDPIVGDAVAQYNELTRSAQTAASEAEAAEIYKQAEQLLIEEIVGIAPIYYYTEVEITKPWLERSYDPIKLHLFQWQLDWEAKQNATQ